MSIKSQKNFEGDAQVAQVLQAGQADVGLLGVYPVISALGSGRNLTMIGLINSTPSDMVVTSAKVTSAEDLNGGVVAINDFGGDAHQSVFLGLKEIGVDIDSLTFTQVGDEAARLAAVTGGSAQAAPVDNAIRDQVEERGLNVLVDLGEVDATAARFGVVISEDLAKACPEKTTAFLRSIAEGFSVIMTDEKTAGPIFADWVGLPENEAEEQIILARKSLDNQQCFQLRQEAFENSRDFMALSEPDLKDLDVSTVYTTEYVDELVEDGVFEELGLTCKE